MTCIEHVVYKPCVFELAEVHLKMYDLQIASMEHHTVISYRCSDISLDSEAVRYVLS